MKRGEAWRELNDTLRLEDGEFVGVGLGVYIEVNHFLCQKLQ